MLADQLPGIYFVAPKVTLAVSRRVLNAQPAPQIPQLLWSADTLAAAPGAVAAGMRRSAAFSRNIERAPRFRPVPASPTRLMPSLLVAARLVWRARPGAPGAGPADAFGTDPAVLAAERHRLGFDRPVSASSTSPG